VDGKEVASKRMEKTLPMILQWDETFDIGTVHELTLKPDRPKATPADEKRLMEESRRSSRASE
jgi:arylsulfatase